MVLVSESTSSSTREVVVAEVEGKVVEVDDDDLGGDCDVMLIEFERRW